ncbi:TadE/TadG family type IV pilus assembly protein [Microvirga terricola]|uniref:Pilus assembly protein n=1 Tax=Microvirga terricola TaxID=2719797 RepID=A0ABX0VFS1_9HYPH|nr:TadE family protein [Microvirga terricola]NIX78378.1 pilus assembly protein [Microvirga terricola]
MKLIPAGRDNRNRKFSQRSRSLWSDNRGVAGIEFALVAGILCVLLLNGIELARYAYIAMQVQNAAQIGAQSAWKACDPTKELPATTKCPGLGAAVVRAIRSTTLGDDVMLQENSPSEAYYCLNNANALIPDGGIPLGSKPSNCNTIAGAQAGQPGDYIKVGVTYAYQPLFLDFTVGRFFDGTITKTTHMRLL